MKPVQPDLIKLGYYLDGQRKHETLEELYGPEAISEFEGMFQGVNFRIDLLDKIPIELKTTRSNIFEKRISSHWIRQLLYYMIATGKREGILQIYLINLHSGNPFPAYRFEIKNYGNIIRQFTERRNNFILALDLKEPARAQSVWKDPEESWVCRKCDYVKECMEIENRK